MEGGAQRGHATRKSTARPQERSVLLEVHGFALHGTRVEQGVARTRAGPHQHSDARPTSSRMKGLDPSRWGVGEYARVTRPSCDHRRARFQARRPRRPEFASAPLRGGEERPIRAPDGSCFMFERHTGSGPARVLRFGGAMRNAPHGFRRSYPPMVHSFSTTPSARLGDEGSPAVSNLISMPVRQ